MKPRSHLEEKTGVPQKAPEAKDKNRHIHPREGN